MKIFPIEWRTLGLILLVYAVLASLVWFNAGIPWWIMLPAGAYFTALFSSLQHEVLHGHPTRSRLINEALIFITPHFWLPYGRYRDTHLQHHNDVNLTDPRLDPESYYELPESWAAHPAPLKQVYLFNHTLLGRMLIGPAVSVARFWSSEFRDMARGDADKTRDWAIFAISCAISAAYITWCGMAFWKYILLFAYPGVSLALVRSFCEHQASQDVGNRTIIVEASPFWSLLFLNNNLHVAHHARPALAWYKLPGYYRGEKAELLKRNQGYAMRGYGEIFRRYFFKAKEPIPYPDMGWLRGK